VTAPPKALTESVLRRLTIDAVSTFLGQAADYEAAGRPGVQLALSNEPIADMNMLIAGGGAREDHFRAMAGRCLDREIPFLAILFPDAADRLEAGCSALGLLYATEWPIMVRGDVALNPAGNSDVTVGRASTVEDAHGSADVLVSAYSMPRESVLRVLPPSYFESPGTDVYLARLGGETVGTVTLTYHGDTCGIWAMGTDTSRQRNGIGRRLLSTAMSEARRHGIRRFFLGATPAGFRLYESLNFKTVCSARVWVSGVTHQA